jgi:hypothetical protein
MDLQEHDAKLLKICDDLVATTNIVLNVVVIARISRAIAELKTLMFEN